MKLEELKPNSLFVFADDKWRGDNPHKVIEQKGETTFCKTPSGKRQYYKSDTEVNGWSHCTNCQGGGCPTCSGYGYLIH